MPDMKIERESFNKLSNETILELLQNIYPERKLYSLSVDWRKSGDYILKLRGTGGDVIVGWL